MPSRRGRWPYQDAALAVQGVAGKLAFRAPRSRVLAALLVGLVLILVSVAFTRLQAEGKRGQGEVAPARPARNLD